MKLDGDLPDEVRALVNRVVRRDVTIDDHWYNPQADTEVFLFDNRTRKVEIHMTEILRVLPPPGDFWAESVDLFAGLLHEHRKAISREGHP